MYLWLLIILSDYLIKKTSLNNGIKMKIYFSQININKKLDQNKSVLEENKINKMLDILVKNQRY